jgi:hypothetical protein
MSRFVSTIISLIAAMLAAVVCVAPALADGSTPIKLLPADLINVAGIGSSVAIDGDTAVVGAPATNGNSGLAYVFVRTGGVWTQQATLQPPVAAAGDGFGTSVAISGDVVLVSSPFARVVINPFPTVVAQCGAVYAFARNGTTWNLEQTIRPLDGADFDRFGTSVALDGESALIGAPLHANGTAYLFNRVANQWFAGQRLMASDGVAGDGFGNAVAIHGFVALVGASEAQVGGNTRQGATYVFTATSAGAWSQQTKLIASDGAAEDEFGAAVTFTSDGSTALIGAPAAATTSPGAAYLFTRGGAGWTQQQKLTAFDGKPGAGFGLAVALANDLAVIGAPLRSDLVGAAYLFQRDDAGWSLRTTVNPPDGSPNDGFGRAVALEVQTVVVGSILNSGHGAAYVFGSGPPTLSPIGNLVTAENESLPVDFTIADPETDANGLSLTVTSSNAKLFPLSAFTFSGTGTHRTLTMNPAPDQNGDTSITLTVSDGFAIASDTFHVRVLPINSPPTVSAIADHITTEDTPAVIPFTLGDVDTALAQLFLLTMSSNSAVVPATNIVIEGSGASWTLTVTPALHQLGTTTITLFVSDGAALTLKQFTVTVEQRPAATYYLAEGATGAFFDTDLLLANPNDEAAPVTITFFKEDGTTVLQDRTLAPLSRTTIHVDTLAGLEATSFSPQVVSTRGLPLMVERTMWWDASGYGAHGEKAVEGAAPQWYFAEGNQGFFSTFFLLVNPRDAANHARVTYFREGASELTRDYALPPRSRVTIDAGADPDLINRSFGALVAFDQPGVAERAMYFGRDPLWSGGHDSAGVTAPSPTWFLAEGATGSFFATFVLIANPNVTDATATLTYFPASGTPVTREHVIPGRQRVTINIADEDPSLASVAVSTRVEATQPVLVERSQYWPQPAWYEGHNSFGVTATATRWGLAEGRVGGARGAQSYILLANPGTETAAITIRFLRTSGAPLVKTFTVPGSRRFNVAIAGTGSDVPELIDEEFGAVIESTQPIVVERALYTNANGVIWAAGTNAAATPLP